MIIPISVSYQCWHLLILFSHSYWGFRHWWYNEWLSLVPWKCGVLVFETASYLSPLFSRPPLMLFKWGREAPPVVLAWCGGWGGSLGFPLRWWGWWAGFGKVMNILALHYVSSHTTPERRKDCLFTPGQGGWGGV